MTTEELQEQLDAHEARIKALVESFAGQMAEANKIVAAGEARAQKESELHVKRAAEHDARERAHHERAAAALDFQRRNVEAWERIASALERLTPFQFSSTFVPSALPGGAVDRCACVSPLPCTDATRCGMCWKPLRA